LIELMVVVAIIGILSAIALPSYQSYVMRGKIPDATSTLSLKAVKLEQYYQDNKTYVGATDCASDTTTSKYFSFQCTASSATAYTLAATGAGSMAGFTYTIDQSNAKATTAVPSGWTANSACWVTNTGGSC
jgi:type IV pilus assembly protein PilE